MRLAHEAVDETGSVETANDNQSGIFALESHLRDYLARNLTSIANFDVPLSVFRSDDGRDGVEFQPDVGPIDLLAITPAGDFYVFELRLGRGPVVALGQILRYMGWVANHVAKGRKVYGVILAADISEKLRYAVTQVPHVSLLEYELRFVVKPISSYGI